LRKELDRTLTVDCWSFDGKMLTSTASYVSDPIFCF
jgi:hypothetical protein